VPVFTHAGVTLHYDRAGSGPAVLLIHGWTCNRAFWSRQVQALRDRHTVVTVDLRGHGESSRPRTGYTIGGMADDLAHLVRALGASSIAVVGWSMGGMVAQELAKRLGDKTRALALVCTTAGGLGEDGQRVATYRKAIEDDYRAFARGFTTSFFKAGTEAPSYAWAVEQTQKTAPATALACLDAAAGFDRRKTLKDVKVRTTVLHGRHDQIIPFDHGEALAKAIKGAKLVAFEQSAHAPFLEEPEPFNDALADAVR
jgi:pimeloyl-ACP methyl ester esterase